MNETSPPESGANEVGMPGAMQPGPPPPAQPSMFEFAPERVAPVERMPLVATVTQPLPVATPPAGGKPRTDVLFFLLGFFTPAVAYGPLIALSSLTDFVATVAPFLFAVLFVSDLVMLLVGRANGNVRLASYGKGGLWAYAAVALLVLLVFGACFVTLGGIGSLGN